MTAPENPRVTRLLVANRGEIARRIIRTADELGIETVAVFSDADRGAPFVDEATYAVALGGSTSAESYLDAGKVLDAARRSGADAVHPGYGFLSENPDFASAVSDAGLVWVGPTPESMRAMALKVEAKRIAAEAGVPLVPGAELDEALDDAGLLATADAVGYPVLVKASAGGGGKGMRVVRSADELVEAVAGARREALSSFGDATVFLERYLERSRHVEVQVFGDRHGTVVHLFERECSIQRRHQKIVEESPSPGATPATLEAMYAAAVALASAISYVGAGTVEFIVSGEGDAQEFFFLEMNTRLQVEHPVTEMVTGLDLVAWQLAVAQGEPIPMAQQDIRREGHAIEVRLYAEDPARGFLPSTGTLAAWDVEEPDDGWLRVDSGFEQGQVVSPYYDPMLAKVIAHGDDRGDVARGLAAYLRGLAVVGVTTNQQSLAAILEHDGFLAGATTTAFLDEHPDVLVARVPDDVRRTHLAVAALELLGMTGYRNVLGAPETVRVSYRDGADEATAVLGAAWTRDGSGTWVLPRLGEGMDPHAAQAIAALDDLDRLGPARLERDGEASADGFRPARLELDGLRRSVWLRHAVDDGVESVTVDADGWLTTCAVQPLAAASGHGGAGAGPSTPVPGTITHVAVAVGDAVEAGQALVVLEAMKMEHTIRADVDGVVTELHVAVGQSVEAHVVVATLGEPA
ncbi:MAG: biotin carboxylase N-terminal domain-containing protein [Candidatus Nanopelagicales bacterium]